MKCYDSTQVVLSQYLHSTEQVLNDLLSTKFSGEARIISAPDLGFPHDVIRIAGGFLTGVYVNWSTNSPFVPVDTCVNVCSVSYLEVLDDITYLFNDRHICSLETYLSKGIYLNNFNRGNHFISYVKSKLSGKHYLVLHSSANEFKENFNGLYPVRNNWFYSHLKKFSNENSYIRYLDGNDAELFYKIAEGLYNFNEIRHEFIFNVFLHDMKYTGEVSHYHHYGMPSSKSVIMGEHLIYKNEVLPILSLPGEDIYMVKFQNVKDDTLKIDDSHYISPHGWGKRHTGVPKLYLNISENKFILDEQVYEIEFGQSLRSHPNLELRDFETSNVSRKDSFFEYLNKMYTFEIVDELSQIASWNKMGIKKW